MTSPAQDDLARLLETLAGGRDPSSTEITSLSALRRDDVPRVRIAWEALPASQRERLIVRASELAEDDATLDFLEVSRLAMTDPDPVVRQRGVESLWESEDRHVGDDLTWVLQNDAEDSVRAAAAVSLRGFVLRRELEEFDEVLGDAVVAALRSRVEDVSEDVEVRARSLEALGFRSLPWVDSLITTAYYHDDLRMRTAAVHAMGASADEKWLEYLYEALHSEEVEMRFEAAAACGSIASEEAVDSVAVLLDDDDSDVAIAAAQALGEISGQAAVQYLREFSTRAPEGLEDTVRDAIELAVFGLEGREDEDDESY
ncbi:MAG: HEAT repeat domain-containing protein [Tepidiformaceae bacterium]